MVNIEPHTKSSKVVGIASECLSNVAGQHTAADTDQQCQLQMQVQHQVLFVVIAGLVCPLRHSFVTSQILQCMDFLCLMNACRVCTSRAA